MHIERHVKIQQQIESYIKGELQTNEIDQLWVSFLKSPEWFDYFETELHLVAIFNE